MTDRVDSAERLLATVLVGRAHVRVLATQYLPPGRAFALDLAALGTPSQVGSIAPPVVNPARSASEDAPNPIVSSAARLAAAELPSDPTWAKGQSDASVDATADALGAAPEASTGPSLGPVSRPIEGAEDQRDHETVLRPEQTESSEPENTVDQAVAALAADPEHVSASEAFDEEPDSDEQTLLVQDAALFKDALDPTAGWSLDDEPSSDDEGILSEMHWGDAPSDGPPASDSDPERGASADEKATAAGAAESPPHTDDPSETPIVAKAPSHRESPGAAEEADDALGEDFELSAEELHWGDASNPTDTSSATARAAEVPAPDEVFPHEDVQTDAADPITDSGAMDDPELEWSEDEAPTRLAVVLPVQERQSDRQPDIVDDEDDIALDDLEVADPDEDDLELHEVASAYEEVVDPESTDLPLTVRTAAGSGPAANAGSLDQRDDTTARARSLPAPGDVRESRPAPVLAVPRVVEPRTGDALSESTGAAAIQILGVGQAQTLTHTLELGEAPDEDIEDGDFERAPAARGSDGGFRLQLEEPEEEAGGPHIPELTEEATVQHNPAMLTPDGVFAADPSPDAGSDLDDTEAQRFLKAAFAAEQKGNLRDAVVQYDDLLSYDPHNLMGHLGRGRCLVDLGDYGAAMSDFTRAEDIAPQSPEPLVEMGNLFFARKEYSRAITYYNHAIELDDSHAMAFSRRGISYYHRRKYADAHDDLRAAEKRDASIPGLQRYIQMTARKLKKRR